VDEKTALLVLSLKTVSLRYYNVQVQQSDVDLNSNFDALVGFSAVGVYLWPESGVTVN